jgi:hypothetical protein
VGIVLDTFNDGRRAFEFLVNPLGVQADQIFSSLAGEGNGGSPAGDWDAIWDSAGCITDFGYVVEIAVPFSSLRFQHSRGDQIWGLDAVRSYPRNVRHHVGLFARDRSNNCYLCQADKIVGFAGVTPGRNLELAPTLSALYSEERDPFPDGSFQERESQLEPGLTARWGITPNLTLGAIIKPDFSQVEADAAQLDVNTQFALFYPEKRPFFLEGVDFFATGLNAVHTRTLVEPASGVKLSGKVGRGALGIFSVQDEVTNLLFPAAQSTAAASLGMESTGSVFRYRHDVGPSSTIGVVATDREGDDYYNRLFGADVDLRFTPKDRLILQMLGSRTSYPESVRADFDQPEGELEGHAIDFVYSHATRSNEHYVIYREVSPDFRADLGFMPQAGYRHLDLGTLHTWWHDDPRHWYHKLRVWFGWEYDEDSDGGLLRQVWGSFIDYHGPLQSSVFAMVYLGKRAYAGHEFDSRTLQFFSGFQPTRTLKLGLDGNAGDEVDYRQGRSGTRLRLAPEVEIFAAKHLHLTLDHDYERFSVSEGRLYTAHLSELRAVYQFNVRAFVRVILQYADYRFNPDLYEVPVERRFRHLLTQLLFSYKINPQTALHVGYSDNYDADHQIDLTQADRTVFLKIGYAWVW